MCFKYEIQLSKVVSGLKVIIIYTKMYSNFKTFWGQMSGGGRHALSENGDKYWTGGIDQIFANGGIPHPPRKKTPCQEEPGYANTNT